MKPDLIEFVLNGSQISISAPAGMPLLWVLRDRLGLTGTKYGCGAGACGACTVHVDGIARYACLTPVSTLNGRSVTTVEGLAQHLQHALEGAWVAEQVPQCGYCQPGQIMKAAALLAKNPRPSRQEIVSHMSGNICRCGTYLRILRAVQKAADDLAQAHAPE